MRKFTSHDYAIWCISRRCVLLVTVLFLWNDASLIAQRNLTLYNLPGVPQSQMMNIGRMPDYNFHLSLPVISNINLGASSSGFSANDLKDLDFDGNGEGADESFFETDFSDFINKIGPYNTMGFDFNTTLIDAGFRVGKGYISLQGTETVHTLLGYSESLFSSFNEIQGLVLEDFDNGPRKYSIYGTYLDFSHHRTLGAGYTHEIIPGKLSAGLRAKMAIGIGRAWTQNEDFDIIGDLQQGILGIEGNVGLLMAGLPAAFDSTQGIDTYLKGSGNKGLALDFGAQYRINDKIEVYASLVNLGQIVWRNNLTQYGYSTKYLDFYANKPDEAEQALEDVIDFVTTPEKTKQVGSIKSPLPMYAYVGGNYHFSKAFSAGAMVNMERLDGFNYWNFAVNGRANVGRVLQAGVTLAQVQGIGFQVGAGAAINLGPVQIYAASDNISSVVNLGNAQNAQVNVGLNFVFGHRKNKNDMAANDSTGVETEVLAVVEDDTLSTGKKVKVAKPKKEKTSVAKTKERATPEPKTSNTPPPAKPTYTAVVATTPPALKPWVNLRGTTYNASSKELMKGVTIELYQQQGDQEVLAYVRGNPGTDILAPMERDKEYRIVVKKNGFKPTETKVSLDELAGVADLQKEFFLEVAPEELPTVVSTKPIDKPVEAAKPIESTPSADSTMTTKPAPTNTPAPPAPNTGTGVKKLEVFVVTSATEMKPTASVDGATVIKISAGFRIQVLEKTNADWWLVRFRDYNGYVLAKVLREEM